MTISTSTLGVGITYRCHKFPGNGRKCPDKYTSKCYRCKHCRAEMSANDATRLMNVFQRAFMFRQNNE